MLGKTHFYNRTIRKVVVSFGTVFNEIFLQRYDSNFNKKEIFKVPLSYGSKEKYITRITSDPNLTRSINVVVPRISFELTGLSYDVSRKQQSLIRNFSKSSNGTLQSQFAPVPYDFNFSLSIYVRNTEDGTQILEQILPSFTPDFTVTVNFIPEMDQRYDVPIILNSVNTSTDYEGDMMTTRLITWDLEFTVKGYIWPAVVEPSGLIGAFSNTANAYGSVKTNLYTDLSITSTQKVAVDYANGSNYFAENEIVRVANKDITGRVNYFSNNSTGILIVNNLNKLLSANDVLIGDETNANYTVTSIDLEPFKVVSITTTPVPQDAEPDDEFGFAETITEWPNTL